MLHILEASLKSSDSSVVRCLRGRIAWEASLCGDRMAGMMRCFFGTRKNVLEIDTTF